MLPSVKIDAPMENSALRSATGKEWVNSSEGQQAKRDNPKGFMNVRLRILAYDAAVKQDQMQQAKLSIMAEGAKHAAMAQGKASVPAAQKSPTETINFKDAGPQLRQQIAAQAGLDASADSEMDAADRLKEHLQPPAPPPAAGTPPGKKSKPPVQ